MQITKFNHSCLLVEEQNKTFLFDPGVYSFDTYLTYSEPIRLDYILITHEHQDHMSIPFLQHLLKKFPTVTIISNQAVKETLATEGITVHTQEDAIVTLEQCKHEKIWFGTSVANIKISIFDKLSHPGDSLSFSKSMPILALPLTAPWGSTTWAVEKAIALKPEVIIPIHDFQWKDEVRKNMYERLAHYFAEQKIRFLTPEPGQIIVL